LKLIPKWLSVRSKLVQRLIEEEVHPVDPTPAEKKKSIRSLIGNSTIGAALIMRIRMLTSSNSVPKTRE